MIQTRTPSQGLIDEIPTVGQLVERIIADAEKLMDAGLQGLVAR